MITCERQIPIADRDASSAVLWAGFIKANTVVMISETLGVITCDLSDSLSVVSIRSSPECLDVASRDVLAATGVADDRFIFVLSTRGVHVVDVTKTGAPCYTFPLDTKSFDSYHCIGVSRKTANANQVVWVSTCQGEIFARYYLGNGILSDEYWSTNVLKDREITFLLPSTTEEGEPMVYVIYDDTNVGAITLNNMINGEMVVQSVLSAPLTSTISSACLSANCEYLLIGSIDGTSLVWDLINSRRVHASPASPDYHVLKLAVAIAHLSFLTDGY